MFFLYSKEKTLLRVFRNAPIFTYDTLKDWWLALTGTFIEAFIEF